MDTKKNGKNTKNRERKIVMEELEAMDKWCPMVRLLFLDDNSVTAVNREKSGYSEPYYNCIGSDCAVWVWDDDIDGHCGLIQERQK